MEEYHKKMSEVDFDEILESDIDLNDALDKYGADVVRLYLLDGKNTLNLIDLDIYRRYVGRLVRLFDNEFSNSSSSLGELINDVTNAYSEFDYKQVIYILGDRINELQKTKSLSKKEAIVLLKLMYPLCPFVTEELYENYISKKNLLSLY